MKECSNVAVQFYAREWHDSVLVAPCDIVRSKSTCRQGHEDAFESLICQKSQNQIADQPNKKEDAHVAIVVLMYTGIS